MTRDEFIKAYESGQRDFRRADLSGANLSGADLSGADLSGADLSYADLSYADLSYADLRYANLSYADLRYANLSYANLRYANLSYADLRDADLSGANLSGANLRDADLNGAKGLAQQIVTPEGALRVYKKLANKTIAVLSVPANAARVNGYGSRKCRAEFAVVLEGSGPSQYDPDFVYAVGATVRAANWNPDPREVCAGGIHFFLTREEAEEY